MNVIVPDWRAAGLALTGAASTTLAWGFGLNPRMAALVQVLAYLGMALATNSRARLTEIATNRIDGFAYDRLPQAAVAGLLLAFSKGLEFEALARNGMFATQILVPALPIIYVAISQSAESSYGYSMSGPNAILAFAPLPLWMALAALCDSPFGNWITVAWIAALGTYAVSFQQICYKNAVMPDEVQFFALIVAALCLGVSCPMTADGHYFAYSLLAAVSAGHALFRHHAFRHSLSTKKPFPAPWVDWRLIAVGVGATLIDKSVSAAPFFFFTAALLSVFYHYRTYRSPETIVADDLPT